MNQEVEDRTSKLVESLRHQASKNTFFWLAVFLAMILGMIAKSVYDNVELDQSVELGWNSLLRRDIILPLLVSPMVFGGIYGIIKQTPKNFGTFIFAFQNGFFWKTVFGETAAPYEQ